MDRTSQLKKVFEGVLKGSISISPQRSAGFLDAIVNQEDPATCMSKLTSSTKGLDALQDCMRYDLSPNFLNQRGTAILSYLQDPRMKDIAGGMFLEQVLRKIVDPPIFWNAFIAAFRSGKLEELGQIAFAGLFLQLLSLSPVDEAHRDLGEDRQLMDMILESPNPPVRSLGAKIKSALSATEGKAAVASGGFKPGGRHDNDFANFRDIAILPTSSEISSTEASFLRTSDFLGDPQTLDQRVETYLDNTFRLLREDMMCEMREEVLIATKQKKGFHRGLILSGFKLLDMHATPDDNRRAKWGIQLQCETDPPFFKKTKPTPKDRKAFLDENRTRYFRHGTLTCLMIADEIVAFPTLHRDENLLVKQPSVLVLQIEGSPTAPALLKLKSARIQDIRVILIDTAVFSYDPVLKAIKNMKEVPVSSELLFWDKDFRIGFPEDIDARLENLVSVLLRNPRSDLQGPLNLSKTIILEKSQHASLLSALTQSLSLIQGPPGTGKSFIGALLGKIIHDFTNETILVVCYTNHALDQFLEDLLDIGIPSDNIVRLGGKSTDRTAPMSLNNLQRNRAGPKLMKSDWQQIDMLKTEAANIHNKLKSRFEQFQSININLGHILDYLEYTDDEEDMRFFDALSVPSMPDEDEVRVGKGGKAVSSTYLLDAWMKNGPPGMFKDHPGVKNARGIWNMSLEARQACVSRWKGNIIRESSEDIHGLVEQYNTCLSQIDDVFMRKDGELVGSKRIIGCTTTAAAKYNEVIRAAKPEMLLVEEAGEILESHILTSLNPKTKQIVLIGDHQQLRPKVNDYRLTVEKGEGYNLNMSLFERLVLKGYPHETLLEQHRMRPEISSLIREITYPKLVDAAKTRNRPLLRGLQDVVIFVNHAHPEDAFNVKDCEDLTSSSSKENTYEAQMVLKTVRYLAQQGYRTDEMTILTPYLGQLQKLKKTLAAENDPILNDLDTHDLIRAGLVSPATAGVGKRKIRLATIGEESDIIIASLTRSNPNRDIGFMSQPERLNVLLSRARNGLIMIGNSDTFSKARKGGDLWTNFFRLLKQGNHIYEGLPIKCERHPTRTSLLRQAVDFDNETPDGGCSEDCGAMLKCGVHRCPSKCHQLSDHSRMPCDVIVQSTCPQNHHQKWKCSQGAPPSCRKCDQEAAEFKRKQQQALDIQLKRDAQKAQYERELKELNDKIAAEIQTTKDTEDERQRQEALELKRKDLEQIRAQNASKLSNLQSLFSGFRSSMFPTTSSSTSSSQTSAPSPLTPTSPSSSLPPAQSHPLSSALSTSSFAGPSVQTSATPSTRAPPSASELEWQRRKKFDGASNDAIDDLMKLTGLEEVKEQVLTIKDKIDLAARQGTSISNERFNVCMLGNPGTGIYSNDPMNAKDADTRPSGKTTVARIYARFLSSTGVLPGSHFIETTGSRLANDGVDGIKKHIEEVINAGGGAIFIDEAYQLVNGNSMQGSQVLDFVLAEMENNVGKVVFILAGYHKQMEKFFEHNPGLPSRVPYNLNFKDYTDEQLLIMLKRLIEKKYQGKMGVEGGIEGLYVRIAIRRLGRGRGKEGFGNARALENVFTRVTERQAKRIGEERKHGRRPNDFLIVKEDLIGPEPNGALQQSASWKKLQKLIGLSAVKETVQNLCDTLCTNYLRELKEAKPVEFSLNRVFTGSPGTGKTTVAKLYGQILADLGLLSNGEGTSFIVVKNPSDFIGAHLGQSEEKTKAILASTVGKVLVIDEAYGLYGGSQNNGNADSFKTAVIDTIVAEVQSVPGEDRCVLLLGYREQMEEMFQNVNPGLSRRFAIENPFQFDDFTESELMEVLELKMRESDISASNDAKTVAREFLDRARRRPNFGNGGDVQNLLDNAKMRFQSRQKSLPYNQRPADIILQPADFDPEFDRQSQASVNLTKLFEDLVGCDEIVQKLGNYQQQAINLKRAGKDARKQIPTCFVFKGPPGTGKTTVARKMGQVFYDMGFLSSKEVVECSASDLVGQYVGHTGPKVQKKFEQALGRVLFIDEAYGLGEGRFAQEAIDEIVSILTQNKFMSKLVVILAGYDDDMNRLMAVNSGLSSRFPETVIFKNMDHKHCLDVLEKNLKAVDVLIDGFGDHSSALYVQMAIIIDQLSSLPGWGNIRDVVTLSNKMIGEAYTPNSTGALPFKLPTERAIAIMRDMLSERQSRAVSQSSLARNVQRRASNPPEAELNPPTPPPPPPPSISTATSTAAKKPPPPPPKKPRGPKTGNGRDPGVSEAVWRQLLQDKKAAEKAARERVEQVREMERQIREAREKEANEARQRILLQEQAKAKALDEARIQALKREQEQARLRAIQAAAERRRIENALQAKREEQRRESQIQQKLRNMGVCVQGFQWIKQPHGYRCAGGSHFVDDAALR
ncbi:hypothetical protein D9757_003572 [Collybiopsis confluens]|uniref:AAA+ ATPase domain-containing protein n=1 Tax=Collybiopsis confluens TaxID=2823264 RepID=A0A8H5MDE4_9AGAR|nr:hypothetical protein D9757_003572 [Collybiopsis confluens]